MFIKLLLFVLLAPLLLMPAASPALAYSGHYYVIPSSAPLLVQPVPGADVLHTVYQGDKVEILERTETGWSRVRLVDRQGIGWIPNRFLSYTSDLRGQPATLYYVTRSAVTLHDRPNPNSRVIATLGFNEPVEMLGVGDSGWAQVRELHSNQVGWVSPRYLSSAPARSQQPSRRRRAPAPKAAPKEEQTSPETPAPPKAM
jgi:uncharacterized protein YgiM (DUF1202 family)